MMHTLLTRSVASRICQYSWLRGQGFYNISFVTGKNTYRYTQGDETFLSIVCFSLKKNNSCRQLKCNYLNVDLSWSETSYSGITRNAKRDFNKLLTTIKAEKLFFPTMLGIMRHDTETEHKLVTMDETCVHLVWPQIKKNCLCTIENLKLPNTCEVITFREYRILMEKLWWLFL